MSDIAKPSMTGAQAEHLPFMQAHLDHLRSLVQPEVVVGDNEVPYARAQYLNLTFLSSKLGLDMSVLGIREFGKTPIPVGLRATMSRQLAVVLKGVYEGSGVEFQLPPLPDLAEFSNFKELDPELSIRFKAAAFAGRALVMGEVEGVNVINPRVSNG